jgi:voltage-gated sodium channel
MHLREHLRRLVAHPAFDGVVLALVLGNALVLGLQTFDGIARDHGATLDLLNDVFLGLFVIEIGLRVGAYGRRPWRFFLDRWNVFDLVLVLLAFAPGFQGNSTLLRLARLLRIVRIVRLLPELRILVTAIARSIPPLFSMAALTALILFVYGMVGWAMFADENPAAWGDIGQSMLTLFVMLTLENLPAQLERGVEIEPLTVVYFVSFVLTASFIVLNVLIGVVLNSMDEARQIHVERDLREAGLEPTAEEVELAVRIARVREALDDLEGELARTSDPRSQDALSRRAGGSKARSLSSEG